VIAGRVALHEGLVAAHLDLGVERRASAHGRVATAAFDDYESTTKAEPQADTVTSNCIEYSTMTI